MKARGFAIATTLKIFFYGTTSLLVLSGISWLILHYFCATESDFGREPSPYESLALTIHGGTVPVFLIIFGALFPAHIQRAYRARKNTATGFIIIGILSLLILTGYLLYYASNDTIRYVAHVSHSVIGVATPLFLLMHVLKGKKVYGKERERGGSSVYMDAISRD